MPWRKQSYEVLPALSIRGETLRRSMRDVTVAWMFGVVWLACVAGSRVNIFARCLGFDDWHFGLMSAIPFAMTFGQLITVIMIERTGLRKYHFLYCGVLHRILWVAIAAVPLVLPVPSTAAVWTMLALLATSSFLGAMTAPAWFTWMGDLIPRRVRGRYFATRSRWAQLVNIPLVMALGLFLDHVTRTGGGVETTAADQPVLLMAISAVFALAGVLGVMDILRFRRVRDVMPSVGQAPRPPVVDIRVTPPATRSPVHLALFGARYVTGAVWQLLIVPLAERTFRRYVIFGACLMFAIGVSGPYFWRDLLEAVGFTQFPTDLLFLVLGPLVGLAAVRGWGSLIDRWGPRPVLVLATAGTVLSVMPYFFASRHTPAPQFVFDAVNWVSAMAGWCIGREGWQWLTPDMPVGAWLVMCASMIFGGLGWGGVGLAQQGVILGFSDSAGRSKHVAAYWVLVGVGGVVGGIVGGIVAAQLAFLQGSPIVVGPFEWNNWHATFVLSWLARIAALLCLIHMPDPGSRRFRDMARYLGVNMYGQIGSILSYPTRLFARRRFEPGRGPGRR